MSSKALEYDTGKRAMRRAAFLQNSARRRQQRGTINQCAAQQDGVNLARVRDVHCRLGVEDQQIRTSSLLQKAEFVPSELFRVIAGCGSESLPRREAEPDE